MDINMRIKEIKERVIHLTKHFPYTEYEINLITLAYISITMLDPTIEDMIDEVIGNTFIFLTSKSVAETCKMIFPNLKSYYIDDLKDADAISHSYEFDAQGNLSFYPYIIIEKDIPTNNLLDAFLHELKHRINEVIPKFDGKNFYSGLNLKSKTNDCYYNIDEAFNCYLVMIYLNNLVTLKQFNIEDVEVKKILDKISKSKSYYYQNLVKPCLPLFQSKKLFWNFYNASLYKDMTSLHDSLNEAFQYETTWNKLFKSLDFEDMEAVMDILDTLDYSFTTEEHKLLTR